ncbi:hypothetical protein [Candidatus Kinetoplastidibacterium blastocrithidiae]|uniref:hypothetical protein n=1 Tax=Candidatus Kinetoplastidibacterium blastocrithidiae TaxID=233181 RepID=UPI003B832595
MVRLIIFQWMIAVVFSSIGLAIDWRIGASFFLGCSAYLIPISIFVVYMCLIPNVINYREQACLFFVGNFIKLIFAVFLIWFFVFLYSENISWFFYLSGLFFSLKGYLLLLIFKRFM